MSGDPHRAPARELPAKLPAAFWGFHQQYYAAYREYAHLQWATPTPERSWLTRSSWNSPAAGAP